MANLATAADLIEYVLFMMREVTTGTSPYVTPTNHVLIQLNRAYRALWLGGVGLDTGYSGIIAWPWARPTNPKYLQISPAYSTGTVSVLNGSQVAAYSVGPGYATTDWFIQITGDSVVYRINGHPAGTAIDLATPYIGTTNATATFKSFKLKYLQTYDVAFFSSPFLLHTNQGAHEIHLIDPSTMQRDYPLPQVQEGNPTRAAIIKQIESGITVQFNKYPSSTMLVECNYVRTPDAITVGTSELWMPTQFRVVVAEFALYFLLEGVDDDRADKHLKNAQAGFASMVKEYEGMKSIGSRSFGQIMPREDYEGGLDQLVRTDDGFIIDMGS